MPTGSATSPSATTRSATCSGPGRPGRRPHSYRAALAIRERLAGADPGNAEWQRDLSVSHDKIGDVRDGPGRSRRRPRQLSRRLAIAERLARADPANAEWQRDLIVSCVKLAEIAPGEARTWLTRALGIARDLTAQGRLAPMDAWIPGDARTAHRRTRRLSAPPAPPLQQAVSKGLSAFGGWGSARGRVNPPSRPMRPPPPTPAAPHAPHPGPCTRRSPPAAP